VAKKLAKFGENIFGHMSIVLRKKIYKKYFVCKPLLISTVYIGKKVGKHLF
jgi:hypothetical protein